jgi:undecaprenyl-diphosphatase
MTLAKRLLFILLAIASATFSLAVFPVRVFGVTPILNVDGLGQINILQAIVLGFLQGVTEFFPISSQAHLKVVPLALGWGDPGVAYTAIIQLGSIAAVLWYFWKDLSRLVKGATRGIVLKDYDDFDFRISMGIVLGTLPIVVCGLVIKILMPDFDKSPLRSLGVIGIASIVMSLLLGVGEKFGKRDRGYEKLSMLDGVLIGVAQAMALIPGVSRSGSTLTAGLLMGLDRETAARFSFLLGIPSITLAGLVELKDVLAKGLNPGELFPLLVGVVSSAVFSYLAIAGLLRFLKTQSNWLFIWYRLAFGVAILGSQLLP